MNDELKVFAGRIETIMTDGRFGVRLDDERRILAYATGRNRRFQIRSAVGDRVDVEMSAYDLTTGRIVLPDEPARMPFDQRILFGRART